MRTFISIILILTSGLIGYFRVLPLYEDVSIAKKEQADIESALSKTKEISIAITELRKKIDEILPSDIDKLDTLLPSKVDEIRFLNMLNFMALDRNIILNDLKVTKHGTEDYEITENDSSGVSAIDVSFSLNTSYSGFKEFLKDIESSLVLIDVNSIKLSNDDREESKSKNLYNYEVALSTYMLE